MRFSANSHDVQRHLGAIIRWQLKLPKRPALQNLFGDFTGLDLADSLEQRASPMRRLFR